MTGHAGRTALRLATFLVALGLGVAASGSVASAAETDGASDIVSCTTYYPSAAPSGSDTTEPSIASDQPTDPATSSVIETGGLTGTAVTGVATGSAQPSDSARPSDLPPSGTGDASDAPSQNPSAPVTACVAAEGGVAAGAAGSTTKRNDPLARSGTATTELVVLAGLLLAVGVALSFVGGRSAARRNH